MSGEPDRDDVFAVFEATREEPVPHLEPRVTARDRADLKLLRSAPSARRVPQHARPGSVSDRRVNVVGLALVLALVVGIVAALVVVVTAIAAAAADGGEATVSGGLDPLWRVGVAVSVLSVVWQAVAWYREERRRRPGGGSP